MSDNERKADMKLTKAEVAARQLDTAIKLFFNAGDVVSVHTLAAASATVFADILEQTGETSWREQIVEEHSDLTKSQVFNILRSAQNFFKHADLDPEESLEFSDTYNDAMIFIATLECGLLLQSKNQKRKARKKLSTPMSVFQLWNIATKPDDFYMPEAIVAAANALFPGINERPRFEQLSIGASVLRKREAYKRRPPPSQI